MVAILLAVVTSDPPNGEIGPLAWTIIVALGTALMAVSALFAKWHTKLYDDLKVCNAARAASEEEVLGMLKVVRLQMERSKGGRQQ